MSKCHIVHHALALSLYIGEAIEIKVRNTKAQEHPLNAYTDISSRAYSLYFGLFLQLDPNFVYTSNKDSTCRPMRGSRDFCKRGSNFENGFFLSFFFKLMR